MNSFDSYLMHLFTKNNNMCFVSDYRANE
uniref:Uncharacterized protein n=1 Tax=Ciona intestinalis TaxID=7719 RepID=H2XKB7_CIOIN